MKAYLNILILSVFLCFNLQAQKDSVNIKTKEKVFTINNDDGVYNPLSPAKAAFLSAVIPGAGQIYNNRYWWQLPLIYGGLGFSIYSYLNQTARYNQFRDAFKLRQAGLDDDLSFINDLEGAQEQANTNRNLSILSAILTYVLQIVEASVRAHLLQFNTTKDLSITPTTVPDYDFKEAPKVGLTIKYTF